MTQELDPGFVLTFTRRALLGLGNFDYPHLVRQVLIHMVEAQVAGLERPQNNDYDSLHKELRSTNPRLNHLLVESFFFLFQRGLIVPEPDSPRFPNLHGRYTLTDRGKAWVNEGGEPIPEDMRGYMSTLTELVPNLDPVIEQYVREALRTYHQQTYFAAAVMIGAASEKAVYILAEALSKAVQEQGQRSRILKALEERGIPKLFRVIEETLQKAKKQVPRGPQESIVRHLLSFQESVRLQRNDAVHPSVGQVNPQQLWLTLTAFPQACKIVYSLLDWLKTNKI